MLDRIFQWAVKFHGGDKMPEEVCREWHSFLIGWAEMFCLGIPSKLPVTELAIEEMEREFHYYQVGRWLGFACLIVLIAGMVKWIV